VHGGATWRAAQICPMHVAIFERSSFHVASALVSYWCVSFDVASTGSPVVTLGAVMWRRLLGSH
jgi:hypothetical protein